jgi:hypothetical protein
MLALPSSQCRVALHLVLKSLQQFLYCGHVLLHWQGRLGSHGMSHPSSAHVLPDGGVGTALPVMFQTCQHIEERNPTQRKKRISVVWTKKYTSIEHASCCSPLWVHVFWNSYLEVHAHHCKSSVASAETKARARPQSSTAKKGTHKKDERFQRCKQTTNQPNKQTN